MRSQRMRQLSAKLTPSWSKHVFALRTKTLQIFFTMQECSPSSTPTSAVRGKEKLSKGEQGTNEVRKSAGTSASQKGGKKLPAPKDNTSKGRSNITLNAAALGSALAEALKSSFEGLRDSMNAGFTGLGALIASHSVDEVPDDGNDDGDSNGSKDDDDSLVDGEPPAKKSRLTEPRNDRNPLISKLTKTLQLTEHVGPAIDGDLASLVDKIMREKVNEDKITDLKKNNTKLPRIVPPYQRQRSIKVHGIIWMSPLGQLTRNSQRYRKLLSKE